MEDHEFETMLLFAFRYCLTRHSYAVPWCIGHLRSYWPKSSDKFKDAVVKEFETVGASIELDPQWYHFQGEISEL